jgi:hypothetical protein
MGDIWLEGADLPSRLTTLLNQALHLVVLTRLLYDPATRA